MDHEHEFLANQRTFWPDVISGKHAEFLHGKTLEDCLDVFGIDVLPFFGYDHVFLTAPQLQMASGVEAAQVSSHQPAVNDGFSRELRIVQVAGHHRLTSHDNFADSVCGCIYNADFHAAQRLAYSIGAEWLQVIDGDGCARFRKAVTVRDGNSQIVKKLQG